jgi:hypothetical protein
MKIFLALRIFGGGYCVRCICLGALADGPLH